jgi:sterol 24-C-methyltransferase
MSLHSPVPKSMKAAKVKSTSDAYSGMHDERDGGTVEARKEHCAEMVNDYYDLVTDFYEYGWGRSFHFGVRRKGESLKQALARHERYLAERLKLEPGMKVLDVGCGVGGPMREIAAFSGASIVGLNNNAYQLSKCDVYNREAQLDELCSTLHGSFMAIACDDATFDAVYQVEATCHAPDRTAAFTEISRVLKPGGLFAGYEWCMTDAYDADNKEHREIKEGIVVGSGLPDLTHTSEVDNALKAAGFDILEARDRAPESDPPWYSALQGRDLSLSSIPRTQIGQRLTNMSVGLMEKIGLAPKGTKDVSNLLIGCGRSLVDAGVRDLFTPMYFHVARKPD